MATNDKKSVTVTIENRNSKDSLAPPTKSPRIPRFAEATSVYSPIDPPQQPPFDYPTNHYQPQAQVSDVGFGYVQSVEMEETDRKYLPPPTPKTPLRSALKSPGAPPRTPGAETMILSPTFREEQILEKREASTEKEQQKDLVCHLSPSHLSTHLHRPENQNTSTGSKDIPTRHQLRLQSDCSFHACHSLLHLQRNQAPPSAKQSTTVGRWPTDLAPSTASSHRLHLPLLLSLRHDCLLERRPSQSREGCRVLHRLRRWFLHLQHHHVGCRCCRLESKQSPRKRQRYVGMVMRGQQTKTLVRG